MVKSLCTIPNLLSCFRLFSVPVLLILAWRGSEKGFLLLLVSALLSDLADGYLARRLHQESELGARLDSWGDFALYITTPLSAWLLWPELIIREASYVIVVLASFVLPILIGFIKYRRLTSYHTWGAKLSAVLMGCTTLLLFAGGPAFPFHLATMVLVLTQIEEICITMVLPAWRANVPSLVHALRVARAGRH
ncbi:MAG: CDP-alcohol phosphatidyltransferase family protein [Deltaproteobacteria bacterium]|nr:CDP-alcohol phosphatidyltransferase family protein [Deltaproteobacteria bacterium]TLN01764.1 MAG: CDP-alcohol phosphatidyltransferase family protein [bacterium]